MVEKAPNLGGVGYRQLSDLVRERIALEHYPVGSLLPSERELADEFQINRRTVRRSLRILEDQQIIVSDSTRGRRVLPSPDRPVTTLALCFDDSLDEDDRLIHATASSAAIAQGFHRRAQQDGRCAVTWLDPENTRAIMNGEIPPRLNLSGLALWPTVPCPNRTIEKLRAIGKETAVVLLDRRHPGFQSDFVGFDDFMVGDLAGRHLAGLGYESFGFVGWAVPETVHQRLAGFAAALKEFDRSPSDEWTILTRTDGIPSAQFHRFLAPNRPRAVFCANDLIAISLLLYVRDHGIRVPEEMAIVGVGDCMSGITETLGLTTLSLPHTDMGWEAADILLLRIRGGRANDLPPIERRKAAQLVVRRTCGACNQEIPLLRRNHHAT